MTRRRWYVFSLAIMCYALTMFVRSEVELSTWQYWFVKAVAIWALQPFVEPICLWALDRTETYRERRRQAHAKRYVIDVQRHLL